MFGVSVFVAAGRPDRVLASQISAFPQRPRPPTLEIHLLLKHGQQNYKRKRPPCEVLALLTPCAFILPCTAPALHAQTSGGAGYGGIGDPAVAPGSPPSSYALSGIEHINCYNGLVNITIPTYMVGGRGNVSLPVVILIQRQWSVSPPNTPTTSTTPLVCIEHNSTRSLFDLLPKRYNLLTSAIGALDENCRSDCHCDRI